MQGVLSQCSRGPAGLTLPEAGEVLGPARGLRVPPSEASHPSWRTPQGARVQAAPPRAWPFAAPAVSDELWGW